MRLIYPRLQRLNPSWGDVADESVPHGFGATGIDQPAIHQIGQPPEHHQLHLHLGEMQVC